VSADTASPPSDDNSDSDGADSNASNSAEIASAAAAARAGVPPTTRHAAVAAVAAERDKPTTASQLLQRGLSVVMSERSPLIMAELECTASTASLLKHSGKATQSLIRQLAGIDSRPTPAERPHSMASAAMAHLVCPSHAALTDGDISDEDVGQPITSGGLPVVRRASGRAPVVCPAALVRAHARPAASAPTPEPPPALAAASAADSAVAPLACGCAASSCYIQRLATLVYSCGLHWRADPPAAPRLAPPPPPPMTAATRADAVSLLAEMEGSRIVQRLSDAAVSDPAECSTSATCL
jgi:hypothetical protein